MRNVAFVAAVILVMVLFIGALYAARVEVPASTVLSSPAAAATVTASATSSPAFAIPKTSSGIPPSLICGVVAENPIKTGQGSGPNTFELHSLAGDSLVLFGWPTGPALPAIGSYMCGRFIGGAPMSGLAAFVRPGEPDYVLPTYLNKTYKFSVVLPEPYRRSAVLSIDRAGGPPQVGFTARTAADEASIPMGECIACPAYDYAAVVIVNLGTGSQTPRQYYAAHESAAGQQIEDTTVDGRAAIRVTNGATFTVQLVVRDGDRILVVGYYIYASMPVPAGASKEKLEATLASFKFAP